jgi:hypothetical protein
MSKKNEKEPFKNRFAREAGVEADCSFDVCLDCGKELNGAEICSRCKTHRVKLPANARFSTK